MCIPAPLEAARFLFETEVATSVGLTLFQLYSEGDFMYGKYLKGPTKHALTYVCFSINHYAPLAVAGKVALLLIKISRKPNF